VHPFPPPQGADSAGGATKNKKDKQPGYNSAAGLHDLGPEAKARVESQFEQSIPSILEALWSVSVIDIEKTTREACKKVLDDNDVAPEEKTLRAKGLEIIGACFLEEAARQDERAAKVGEESEAGSKAPSAKEVVEDAMRRTMMRKMQQEESDEAPVYGAQPQTTPRGSSA